MSLVSAAVLAAWPGTQVPGQAAQPASGERKIYRVPGNAAWTATGIVLRDKDRVKISASGKVCFSDGQAASCQGPEGKSRAQYPNEFPADAKYCNDPLPQANHATLIARVGNQVFAVGPAQEFSGRAGALGLGINDCTFAGDLYNTGEFTVAVVVESAR